MRAEFCLELLGSFVLIFVYSARAFLDGCIRPLSRLLQTLLLLVRILELILPNAGTISGTITGTDNGIRIVNWCWYCYWYSYWYSSVHCSLRPRALSAPRRTTEHEHDLRPTSPCPSRNNSSAPTAAPEPHNTCTETENNTFQCETFRFEPILLFVLIGNVRSDLKLLSP